MGCSYRRAVFDEKKAKIENEIKYDKKRRHGTLFAVCSRLSYIFVTLTINNEQEDVPS